MLLILYQNPVQFFAVIPRGVPLPHSNALQYYVKREKCKVNDVKFPSGFEARAINLGNKNMKICIFTGCTSVRSKNIFTDISRYPTGKHEINSFFFFKLWRAVHYQEGDGGGREHTTMVCTCNYDNSFETIMSIFSIDNQIITAERFNPRALILSVFFFSSR